MPASVSIPELGASRSDQLARIMEAGLVDQGRVFALSLEAVRKQLGPRWDARKDHVWETFERALVKRMPPPDLFIRLDGETVLAAIASTDAYEAQVRCADVLRSILAFFLGRSAEEDLGLSRISGLAGGQLITEPIDLTAPPPPPAPAAPLGLGGPDEAQSASAWTPPLAGRSYLTQILTSNRGPVPMRFDVAPVWRLDQGVISAYAIRRRLPAPVETYSDRDREEMGHRLLDYLVPLLKEYRREGGVFALLIPGCFSNVSTRRPRHALLDRCVDVMDIMRRAVVMEIDGFNVGAPSGRIGETVAMMKPFFRVLTATVHNSAQAQDVLREYCFGGVSVDAEGLGDASAEKLICMVRRRTPNVVVHGARRGIDEDRLRSLGVSHVTYREDLLPHDVKPDASVPAWPPPPAPPAAE